MTYGIGQRQNIPKSRTRVDCLADKPTGPLLGVRDQVQNCLSAYARELRRRDTSSERTLAALAPNGDIIYGYLQPSLERDFATPAIEALLQTEEVRTLVLPSVREELRRVFHYYISVLDKSFYSNVGTSGGIRPEGSKERVLDELRRELAQHYDYLATSRFALERLSTFLSSKNVDPGRWADTDPSIFNVSDTHTEDLYKQLVAFCSAAADLSRWRSSRHCLTDSHNVGMILAASQNGVFIPFVTDSRKLTAAFESAIKAKHPEADGLLVGSFTAVTIVALVKATTADIRKMRDSAMAFLSTADGVATEQKIELTREKFNTYLELTFRLAEIGSLVNCTWKPPKTSCQKSWTFPPLPLRR